jgi:excisionase family DNA binding protein
MNTATMYKPMSITMTHKPTNIATMPKPTNYPIKNKPNQYGLLLSAKEAQVYLGLTRNMIYSLAKTDDLPTIKIGGRVFFPREGLRTWVNDNIGKEILK